MENQQNNFPEVKLGQYKGLAVTRHVRGISEKTLDIEMVHQTRMRATYHNSTEAAKRGSRVLLDFAGFMDGKEIPDSRMEKVMVVLGATNNVDGVIGGEHHAHMLGIVALEHFRCEAIRLGGGWVAQFVSEHLYGVFVGLALLAYVAVGANCEAMQRGFAFLCPFCERL